MQRIAYTAAAALAAAATANAAFIELENPLVLQNDAVVSVELVGKWAGAEGDVYFLGAKPAGESLNASDDTGVPGLGRKLFASAGAAGTRVELGQFDAGTELHFGYYITKGHSDTVALGDIFRSDNENDQVQLGWDPSASSEFVTRLGWEDIRDPKRSDWDYRDVVFDVRMTPPQGDTVPSPGAAMLIALSTGVAAARRRR